MHILVPCCIWKINFLLFLFFSSENYLVRWSSSGLPKDIDRLHNLRAVFTVSAPTDVQLCYSLALTAFLVTFLLHQFMGPWDVCNKLL
jgi:hypothetical protein